MIQSAQGHIAAASILEVELPMSVLWLRTAAALYGCGLLYALIYLFRKSTRLFRPALIAFGAGTIFHLVSIAELWAETGHLPLNNFYETSSVCAFLIAFPASLHPISDLRIWCVHFSTGFFHDHDWGD